MTIPAWALQIIIVGICGFVVKTIYGLIVLNQEKGDKKDKEIEDALSEMNKIYRNNDRELYKEQGKLWGELEYMKGFRDGLEKGKSEK